MRSKKMREMEAQLFAIRKEHKMSNKISAAIDKLAGLYEFGHLQAETAPDEFLAQVTDEIAALREENERLKRMALDALGLLQDIQSGMKERSGDPFEECPYCMGELFSIHDEDLIARLNEIPRPEGE
jgi:hypothetical protein